MKTIELRSLRLATIAAMALSMLVFTGCADDEEEVTPAEIVLDGFYIQGSASAYDGFNGNATLQTARVENFNDAYNNDEIEEGYRSALKEIYLPLQAGTFSITQVNGADRVTWGSNGTPEILGPDNDQPNGVIVRGDLSSAADATPFAVAADGFYHIVIDAELGKFIISEVASWGIIGAATPGGWGGSTALTTSSFDFNNMSWEITDLPMVVGDFKFRYANGWKITLDPDFTGEGPDGTAQDGLRINTNFGGSVSDLVSGGNNITNSEAGVYTVTINWTPAGGYAATAVKTADLPLVDYSAVEFGLVGESIVVSGAMHNWDETVYIGTPSVNGTVYTWDMGQVSFTSDGGGFKIREGQTWDERSYGYNEVTVSGDGAGNFGEASSNFVHTLNGTGIYNVTFVIDADADTREIIFNY